MPLPTPILSLALQIVPILVFLVVDALVQDPLWAIGAALAFVVLQAVVTRARGRPFDKFLLLDLGLIGGLGAISLITRNELFFKLKPALLEGVMVPYLVFLAAAREQTLLSYFARYSLGQSSFNPAALPMMRRLLGAMAVLVALHAGLTVLAALRFSKRAWGLISGPGFYVLLIPLLGYVLLLRWHNLARARAAAAAPPPEELPPPRPGPRRRRHH
jgi:intracellular septation protein A